MAELFYPEPPELVPLAGPLRGDLQCAAPECHQPPTLELVDRYEHVPHQPIHVRDPYCEAHGREALRSIEEQRERQGPPPEH